MKSLTPNSMIQNRYLVVHPIGKGGMGEVYLAVDQRLGSAVAIKRTFFSEDDSLANAFEREARILARLRHPVLPKVIDHFMENGDQFLVMEHISGDDLSKRIENANKPFPLSWVMFWADQMLDALSYLHSHEPPIIHRDIKPQNLKLTDENHIVLLDFGLSKDFDTSSASTPMNSASVVGYSPHFASMEQVRGTGTDARSDLYSLSATFYQLLTNQVPPDSLTRADGMLGSTGDPIKPINELNAEVPPAVSEVILKGMAVRQDQRFATAGEMQKALRRAFNQGKADAEDAKMVIGGDLPVSESKTRAPQSDASEMATRMRADLAVSPMDVTMQMGAVPDLLEVPQADVKTAIFTQSDISAPEPEPTPVDFSQPDPEPELEPQPEPMVVAAPVVATAAAAAVGSTSPSQSFTIPVEDPTPVKPRMVAEPKKKSKGGLIVGGLIGLLLLVGVVAAGGWYAYNKMNAGVKPTSSPTPVANTMPSPIPALTESNTNTNTNQTSNVAQMTNSNIGDSNANTAVSTTATPEPGTPKSPQVPTTKQQTPVKTTQAPVVKSTPKPPASSDRQKILQ